MAKATKRGKRWRCLVFSHYEYEDGNKIRKYKSFTADTKREAERQAAKWEYDHKHQAEKITVMEAIEKYIETKEGVLSSSTTDAYRAYLESGKYAQIEQLLTTDLTQLILQTWITKLAVKYSPKYIENIYALFSGAMGMADLDLAPIAPTLPQKEAEAVYVPYDAELRQLFAYLDKPEKYELRIACLLAAFGSLRRSEICALENTDFDGATVRISKAMVRDGHGGWRIQKHAKNDTSNRTVVLPQEVAEAVDLTRKRVINTNPDAITNRFRRAVKYAKLPQSFTLHSLRHYYVSIAHVLGIPDQYIMKMGGWKTDAVMKRKYRTTLSDIEQREQDKINAHFSDLMQPKCNQKAEIVDKQ